MRRIVSAVLLTVLTVSMAGCAKPTASEQLRNDMKKMGNDMKRETNSWTK